MMTFSAQFLWQSEAVPCQSQKWNVTYSIAFMWNFSAEWSPIQTVTLCYSHTCSGNHFVKILIMAKDCGWRALLKLPNILFSWSFPYCTCKVRDSGRRLCIVIVAEGAQEDSGNPVTSNHIREVRILAITKFPCELSATITATSS